jgi:hypothetical protein
VKTSCTLPLPNVVSPMMIFAPLARVADRGHDGPLGDEGVDDLGRLIEQATGVAA